MARIAFSVWMACGLILLSGCASVASGGGGQTRTVSVQSLNPEPPSVMVRHTSELPLYILVDSEAVPARFNVDVTGTYHNFSVTEFHHFAERDLRRFFENYFDDVQVLVDEVPDDSSPHFLAELRVTRLKMGHAGGGYAYDYAIGDLNWALGFAYSEADDYLLSLAAESVGSATNDPQTMVSSVLEGAIADLGKAFADNDIYGAIQELTAQAEGSTSADSDDVQ